MSKQIENARESLMKCGKDFLLNNPDGKAGKFKVRDLTSQCGMALGTFYHYFYSKDDLARQIIMEDWLHIMHSIDAIIQGSNCLYEKVKQIYTEIFYFEKTYRYSALNLLSPTEENQIFKKECFVLFQEKIRDFLITEINNKKLHLDADPEKAAYLLLNIFSATARNPNMNFEDLWMCMSFRDISD